MKTLDRTMTIRQAKILHAYDQSNTIALRGITYICIVGVVVTLATMTLTSVSIGDIINMIQQIPA